MGSLWFNKQLSALIGFVNILFIVSTITKRNKEIIENIKLKSREGFFLERGASSEIMSTLRGDRACKKNWEAEGVTWCLNGTAQIPTVPLPHEKRMVTQMKFPHFSLFSPFKNSHFSHFFELLIFRSEFFNITWPNKPCFWHFLYLDLKF